MPQLTEDAVGVLRCSCGGAIAAEYEDAGHGTETAMLVCAECGTAT
jgi:hypothetical protein